MFTQYVWPYPVAPVWGITFILGCILQFFFKMKFSRKLGQRIIPAFSALIMVIGILVVYFVPGPSGVLLGELDNGLAVGGPGLALLVGALVGNLFSVLYTKIRES